MMTCDQQLQEFAAAVGAYLDALNDFGYGALFERMGLR